MSDNKNIETVDDPQDKEESGNNEKLFTQVDLDSKIRARLEREKKKTTDLQNKYDEVQDKIKEGEFEALKKKIASDTGLPGNLIGRLTGKTEDEITRDAKELSKIISLGNKTVGRETNPSADGKVLLTVAEVKAMSSEQRIGNMRQIEKQLKDGTLK